MGSIQVSLIVRISEEAARRKQAGEDIISLGTGEPDFDTPEHIKQAAKDAIDAGQTKYTGNVGTLALRQAIARKYAQQGVTITPNRIIASTGAKQVLFNAMMATLDPGDEVIVPTPYWTSYADIVAICGGKTIELTTNQEDGFVLAPETLAEAITDRTRWLLINSPSNPAGSTWSQAQMRALLPVLQANPHVALMSDEIYEHLVYDEFDFCSALQALPELEDRTLVVNGVSKAYAMTGWRLGYGVGPVDLIAAMSVVQGQATSAPSSISQAAAAAALLGPQDEVAERRDQFDRRRRLVVDGLNAIDGLVCAPPLGAFYAFPNCSALFGMQSAGGKVIGDDVDVCDFFLESAGVALVPGSAFGSPGHMRLSYAYAEADLRRALGRLHTARLTLTRPARTLT
ncbi:pyridoxal phosphate-dependent aminotransferase [Devosia sp. 1566]|uniref:pyridoxal phosphate-dependent aminotransferase n=1 Tax=Devosia sp. 1566 TaxID=2499144 RepID=UPI0020BF20B7|nr:pyridoxal phosphate-dependent aminotransferase [Devosia sp. 1566]